MSTEAMHFGNWARGPVFLRTKHLKVVQKNQAALRCNYGAQR